MNKLKFYFVICSIAMLSSLNSFGFGKVGHATIAKIAENHLTPTAKANIEKYLNGESIVTYASWMDHVRKTDDYKHTDGWHTAALDEKGKVLNVKAVKGLNGEISKLENGKYKVLSDSAVAVGIKLITHLVGDMHCPSHSRFQDLDQKFNFKVNGHEFPFHKFFDAGILNLTHPDWTYEDYAKKLDTLNDKKIQKLQFGTVKEWAAGNGRRMRPLYTTLKDGATFSGKDAEALLNHLAPLEEKQMQIAGYRLAGVLNRIFGQ